MSSGKATVNAGHKNVEAHKFKPGQSGNPAGRVPGSKNLSTILAKYLENDVTTEGLDGIEIKVSAADAVVLKLIRRAVKKGDYRAIREIFDRLEGRTKQSVDVTTDGKPLTDEVDYTKLSDNVLRAIAAARKPTEGAG